LAINTYATLQTGIIQWLNRTGDTDLTARAPDFIDLAEQSFRRRREFQDEIVDQITISGTPHNLPTSIQEIRSLYFDDGTRQGPIAISTPERIALEQGISGRTTGFPRSVAVTADGTQLITNPDPDQAYTVELIYLLRLDPLSATNTTNWLLNDHHDVYLYGSLAHSAPYYKDLKMIEVWKGYMNEGIAEMRDWFDRRRFGGNSLVMRPKRSIGGGGSSTLSSRVG
jgi:hypothetical protein